MISGLCLLMLASRRQITMFCLVGVLIVNKMLYELIQLYTKNGLEKLTKIITGKVGYIIMIVVMLGLSYHFYEPKQDDDYIDESTYPVQACDYILGNIDLGKARFYNEYNYGSYMIYRGIPVFMILEQIYMHQNLVEKKMTYSWILSIHLVLENFMKIHLKNMILHMLSPIKIQK